MGNLGKAIILVLVLVFLASLVALQPVTVKAQPITIVVPDDYPTIQDAINNAGTGDTVFVKNGLYNETLNIDKSISLIGEDRNSTIIDARKAHSQVIAIKGDDITVANFTLGNTSVHTLRNGGDVIQAGEGDGIVVNYPSHNVNIVNNTVIGCPIIGIYSNHATLIGSDTTILPNVNIVGNSIFYSDTAIEIDDINCFVLNNTYADTTYGVKFEAESITVGIAGGPTNGTEVFLSERNVVQGNQEINVTAIPSPFPSIAPTPSPSPQPTLTSTITPSLPPTLTSVSGASYASLLLIALAVIVSLLAIIIFLLLYIRKRNPINSSQ